MSHDLVRIHYIYNSDGTLDRVIDDRELESVKAWWIKRLELMAKVKIEDEWTLEQQRYSAIGALSPEDQKECGEFIASVLSSLDAAKQKVEAIVDLGDTRQSCSDACDEVQKVGLE
tara:strand:- start:106 stop:453 length:348 start_codon:yes stop_codon:yes gene_type:complete